MYLEQNYWLSFIQEEKGKGKSIKQGLGQAKLVDLDRVIT